MDSNRLTMLPLHMRNDHLFMSSNQHSSFDSCRGDGEAEKEEKGSYSLNLKVKGHVLWPLNVTVRKTEI